MGAGKRAAKAFIESIPDIKLSGLPTSAGTIYKDVDFRLDMQGMTSGKPQFHNLQLQVNKGTTITSLKAVAPNTISTVLVSQENPPSAAEIKASFTANLLI